MCIAQISQATGLVYLKPHLAVYLLLNFVCPRTKACAYLRRHSENLPHCAHVIPLTFVGVNSAMCPQCQQRDQKQRQKLSRETRSCKEASGELPQRELSR